MNVALASQRSPFRYPGGKTWLIPTVRRWLKQIKPVELLIEPFAGGGIVSLTAAFENLSNHIVMVELDEEVAAVWEVILKGIASRWYAKTLAGRIRAIDFVKHKITFSQVDALKVIEENSMNKNAFFTYDDVEKIRLLADKYKLLFKTIPMKTTHHLEKNDLIISDNFNLVDKEQLHLITKFLSFMNVLRKESATTNLPPAPDCRSALFSYFPETG